MDPTLQDVQEWVRRMASQNPPAQEASPIYEDQPRVPLAPAGVESPLANWARRLVIGPRQVVQEIIGGDVRARLQENQMAQQQALETQKEGARATRTRENLLLQIQEQAKATQAGQVAKEQREADERSALANMLAPVLPPEWAAVIRHKGGLEAYKAAKEAAYTLRPEETRFLPGGIQEATGPPKPEKPWYSSLSLPGMVMMRSTLQAKVKAGVATPEEQEQLRNLEAGLPEYERITGQLATARGAGGEAGRYGEQQTQAIGDKASQYVHPQTLRTPDPSMPVATVQRDYRHIPTARNPETPLVVKQMLHDLAEVIARRPDLFPNPGIWAVSKATLAQRWGSLSGDPDVAQIGALMATIPTLVRSFGDTGNIAYVERQMTQEAVGMKGDSNVGAVRRLRTLLDMTNQRLRFHGLDPMEIPILTRLERQLGQPNVGGRKPTSEVPVPR